MHEYLHRCSSKFRALNEWLIEYNAAFKINTTPSPQFVGIATKADRT